MQSNKECMEAMKLAYDALKARHRKMREKNPDLTLAACLELMNKSRVKAANEQGDNATQLPKIEIEWDGGTFDYVAKPVKAEDLRKLRARKPKKDEDEVAWLKSETGLMLAKNGSHTAKRGRETAEFQAKTYKRNYDAARERRDAGIADNLDGSKGGLGSHLSEETKNCPLVAAIQKYLA